MQKKTGKKLRKQTKEKNKEKPSSAASTLRKKCPSSGKLSHHQKSIVTSNYTSVYSSVVEGSKDWTKLRSAPTGDKKGAHLEHALLPLQPLLPLPHHPQELPARIWSRCHQILFDNRLILYYFLLLLICCFAVLLFFYFPFEFWGEPHSDPRQQGPHLKTRNLKWQKWKVLFFIMWKILRFYGVYAVLDL